MASRRVDVPSIADLETALRIFYEHPELGNAEIRELFGGVSSSTIAKLKNQVRELSEERGTPCFSRLRVNTDDAYDAWGLDVAKLEQRYSRLMKLRQKGASA